MSNSPFASSLATKAAANIRKIVLPEGNEIRVLRAANEVLSTKSAALIIIGESDEILATAKSEGLFALESAISGSDLLEIYSHNDSQLIAKTAELYADLRKSKGVTLEDATATVKKDVSTFATLLVKLGLADGMVSGAVHTTAETIRPALQIIKTKPAYKTVSGAFFMCIPGNAGADETVYLFADCAVNPNPTPELVADIAFASNETAKSFSINPKVALLNYSTIDSGKGVDVDATLEAVKLLAERAKTENVAIDFEGPLQFDAAVDVNVAATKAPNSNVAGKANVFIFPDLKSGNICYKAVQRTANALAIGPVLQGLNAPVNDLSRGALVEDIVNTIYLTAVQAGD